MLGRDLLWLVALCLSTARPLCTTKQVLHFDAEGKALCLPCPQNCGFCLLNGEKKPVCVFCEEGFFSQEGHCVPCISGCAACTGPELSRCSQLAPSHFYNTKEEKIDKCLSEGCTACSPAAHCVNCDRGYYAAGEAAENGVTCRRCEIDNCSYCAKEQDQVKNISYMTCKMCNDDYGLVGGKCERCAPNCEFCFGDAKECLFCRSGFSYNKREKSCNAITVENCDSVSENGVCRDCSTGFYLQGGKCLSCSAAVANCLSCHAGGEEVTCRQCLFGYRKASPTACEPCPANCTRCDAHNCLSCEEGMHWNATARLCANCTVPHCVHCTTADTCSVCESGYFYTAETGSCQPCRNDCLVCSSNGERCLSCGVDHYAFEEELAIESKPTKTIIDLLSQLLVLPVEPTSSPEYRTVLRCVKSCPATIDGMSVVVKEESRQCFARGGKVPGLAPPRAEPNNVLSAVTALKTDFDARTEQFIASAQHHHSKDASSKCNYRGTLKHEVKGDFDSYYICRCEENVVGDTCEIPLRLYDEVQTRALRLLEQAQSEFLSSLGGRKPHVLQALAMLTQLKLSYPVIRRTISLLRGFLQRDRNLENKKKLYLVYDGLILATFDHLEDIKKQSLLVSNLAKDLAELQRELRGCIATVIGMLEAALEDHLYAHSFLERGSAKYVALETFSFIFSEERVASHTPETGFVVHNPNIDTSFQMTNSVRVLLEFTTGSGARDSPLNLQLINFSATLFEAQLQAMREKIVSHVLYLKFLDPAQPHVVVSPAQARTERVSIVFSMIYVPPFAALQERIRCAGYDFFGQKPTVAGRTLAVDDEKQTVTCEFRGDVELRNYYFAATYAKE